MSDNTWTHDKPVSGFITIHRFKKMFSMGVADAKCGESGKVIAIFGEVKGKYEDETIRNLKRVIACVNFFVGIDDVKKWIKEHPRTPDGEGRF